MSKFTISSLQALISERVASMPDLDNKTVAEMQDLLDPMIQDAEAFASAYLAVAYKAVKAALCNSRMSPLTALYRLSIDAPYTAPYWNKVQRAATRLFGQARIEDNRLVIDTTAKSYITTGKTSKADGSLPVVRFRTFKDSAGKAINPSRKPAHAVHNALQDTVIQVLADAVTPRDRINPVLSAISTLKKMAGKDTASALAAMQEASELLGVSEEDLREIINRLPG